MEETKSLLALATTHVNQYSKGSEKTDYQLQLNETGEVIYEFPKALTDAQMFGIMDFMKKYELEAFNTGIKFQKTKDNKVLKETIDILKGTIDVLEAENDRLANALDISTKGV